MNAWFFLLPFCAAGISWVGSRIVRDRAIRYGAVDVPKGGRKIHRASTPLWGGVGIALACLIVVALAVLTGRLDGIRITQILGCAAGIVILVVGGMIDDRYDLPPLAQLCFPSLAAIIVVATGTRISEVSQPFGGGIWSLDLWRPSISFMGKSVLIHLLPDILTVAWLLLVSYATKLMDGLDGLVAGQTIIGAALIAALSLSPRFFQPSVALLALIVLGAFLGFLPSNLFPAKHFLGEGGSTLAGFLLGFLAVVSGAKVATAFMALGLPLVDVPMVVVGRLLRGASPFQGDNTHLHFKLLRAGLSQRQVVAVFWAIALGFGAIALGLQTRGKMILLALLILLALSLSLIAGVLGRRAKR